MKRKLFLPDVVYRGRFAPSPTGSLHFGSLVAAVGSYLDAKHHNGIWLVRIEDLDTPRTVKGAADDILRTLEAHGLYWDETVIYQSQCIAAYEEALQKLQAIGAVYPCSCTRKEIADSALHGIDGMIYPGACRNGITSGREGRAWRVRTDCPLPNPLDETTSHSTRLPTAAAKSLVTPMGEGTKLPSPTGGRAGDGGATVEFNDALQGRIVQNLASEIGDFVVLRADGLFAYQLAVVVDDAAQGITHVVRGADLLTSTTRQIYLQRLLGFATPAHTHLPIAVNAQGEKLSKQTLAAPVDTNNPVAVLLRALAFLRQEPPAELSGYDLDSVLGWAIAHWDKGRLNGIMQIPV